MTSDVVTLKGEKRHEELTRIADGKEHSVEGVNVPGDTEIVSPDLTVIRNSNGKRLRELHVRFSPDGKTHTVTTTSVDANGKPYEDVGVFERQ